MNDHNLEKEPTFKFESAAEADQPWASISHEKQTKIFTRSLPVELSKVDYRSIVNSNLGSVESHRVIKNILEKTQLIESGTEAQIQSDQLIDNATAKYQQLFFDDNNGRVTKNVAAVEELFEKTALLENFPLLELAIDIRRSFPKQTNVVEAEHIIRMLILDEIIEKINSNNVY